MKYKRIEETVDAVQWTGDQEQVEDPAWLIQAINDSDIIFYQNPNDKAEYWLEIVNDYQNILVMPGDYIVKNGDKYFRYDEEVFESLYVVVDQFCNTCSNFDCFHFVCSVLTANDEMLEVMAGDYCKNGYYKPIKG